MNKENAHLFLPLVQALADGKTIQFEHIDGHWEDGVNLDFGFDPKCYRIKTEPRTFEIVINKMTGSIFNANDWDGTSSNVWERITVQEVLP